MSIQSSSSESENQDSCHAPKPLPSLGRLAQCYDSQVLDEDIEMEDAKESVYLMDYGLQNDVYPNKLS